MLADAEAAGTDIFKFLDDPVVPAERLSRTVSASKYWDAPTASTAPFATIPADDRRDDMNPSQSFAQSCSIYEPSKDPGAERFLNAP